MRKAIIIFLISTVNVLAQNVSDNLIIHYEFNGNSDDSSSNSYNGTPSGVVYVNDRDGNPNSAVYFDGVDDFIDLPNLIELKPELPISFSFWIKYESDNYQDRAVFNTSFEDDRSSGVYFNTQISTGNYAINYGDGTYNYISTTRRTLTSNEAIETENWHHIAVVIRSATDMSIYVDCIDYGGSYSGTGGDLVYSDAPGSLGRRDRNLGVPANYFKGMLDEFMYWSRELTVLEIDQLCNEVLSLSEFDSGIPNVRIYPIPTNNKLNIETTDKFEKILIFNSVGQIVYKKSYSKTIDLNNLRNGIYFLKLISNTKIVNKKIIIE